MPLKLYYLDDEKDLLDIFADTFSSATTAVSTFSDPDSLLLAIENERPDLVFLDCRMPKTNGHKVAALIDSRFPGIPKALVTGDMSSKPLQSISIVFEKPMNLSRVEEFIESVRESKGAKAAS